MPTQVLSAGGLDFAYRELGQANGGPPVILLAHLAAVLGPTWIHRWGYSTAKALDEHLAFAYADRGLAMSIVRYFNAYGPRLDQ